MSPLADNTPVESWTDVVGGAVANAVGAPSLVPNELGGSRRGAVRSERW